MVALDDSDGLSVEWIEEARLSPPFDVAAAALDYFSLSRSPPFLAASPPYFG